MKEIVLPFSGFYNSIHDQELDNCLEREFSDRETGCDVDPHNLLDSFHLNFNNWSLVQNNYAEQYTKQMASEFDIDLVFVYLDSPKYYNYSTDRIAAHVSDTTIAKMYKYVMRGYKKDLEKAINGKFTSYDGFISYYPNTLVEWPALKDWDCNQLGTLLHVYIEAYSGSEFDQYTEYSLCADFSGNGYIANWLYSACDKKALQVLDVHHYLELRKDRIKA